jgi:Rad3-related DNA helicase
MPFDFGFPLRDYQEKAIRAVEHALDAEQRSMLLAMATGTGQHLARHRYALSASRHQEVPSHLFRC